MNYLLLNLVFVVLIFGLLLAAGQLQKLRLKPLLLTLLLVLVATAIFDSLIVHLGLVTYDPAKILEIYIGKAPIEDFAYAVVVVGLVPVLWKLNGERHD